MITDTVIFESIFILSCKCSCSPLQCVWSRTFWHNSSDTCVSCRLSNYWAHVCR